MFQPVRLAARRSLSIPQSIRQAQRHQHRFISSTPPAQKSRSFKNGLARWAIAIGGLYWYTTRDIDVFAEDARTRLASRPRILETQNESEELPTVDTLAASRREARRAQSATAQPAEAAPLPPVPQKSLADSAPEPSSAASSPEPAPQISPATSAAANPSVPDQAQPDSSTAPADSSSTTTVVAETSPASLEEEAEAEGAFNEQTGEINWDCPCLGGMAHGPCGEQFRDAFSCFVFSKEEPKGIDCIDRFRTMQDCFREHPDVYGAELTDMDEDPGAESEGAGTAAEPQPQMPSSSASQSSSPDQATYQASVASEQTANADNQT